MLMVKEVLELDTKRIMYYFLPQVHQRDVNKFQLAYCNLLKSNMDGLKRQKKTKLKKATQ